MLISSQRAVSLGVIAKVDRSTADGTRQCVVQTDVLWNGKQNVNVWMWVAERWWWWGSTGRDQKKRHEGERGARGGGLMCPSWGEAGQKWLGVELNWLHYRGSAPESISDISRPSQRASYRALGGGEGNTDYLQDAAAAVVHGWFACFIHQQQCIRWLKKQLKLRQWANHPHFHSHLLIFIFV